MAQPALKRPTWLQSIHPEVLHRRWGWWGNESTATVFSEKLAIQFPRDDRSPLASLCLHVCTCLRIHDQFRARVLGWEKHQLMLVMCNSARLHAWAPHCTTAHLHSPPICAHVGFNLLGRVNPSMECFLFSYLAAFLSLVDQLFHIPDLNIRGFPKRVARSGRHPTSGRLSAVPSQHHHPRNGGFLKWIKMEVFPNHPS